MFIIFDNSMSVLCEFLRVSFFKNYFKPNVKEANFAGPGAGFLAIPNVQTSKQNKLLTCITDCGKWNGSPEDHETQLAL